jgi:hypothetical protein
MREFGENRAAATTLHQFSTQLNGQRLQALPLHQQIAVLAHQCNSIYKNKLLVKRCSKNSSVADPLTFWYTDGSGSGDPYISLTDPDSDLNLNPAPNSGIFVSDLQDDNKKLLFF